MGTKQFDSATDLITFTRASGGTALRKISYGSELVTNGTFDGTGNVTNWTVEGTATNNNGVNKFDVTAGETTNVVATQTIALTIGGVYQMSFERLAGTVSCSVSAAGAGLPTSYSSTVGVETRTFVATASSALLLINSGSGSTTVILDNVSLKEVTFDQPDGILQLFNSPANTPRIEYNADGTVKGLLIEEARTNLLTYSQDFSNSGWSKINSSVSANATTAPDGTTTADKIIPDTSINQHRVDKTPTSSAGDQTFSVYVKDAGYGFAWMRIGTKGARFSIADGTTTSISTGVTASSQDVGNGWRLLSISYSASANDTARINALENQGGSDFAGDGTSGIYVWGAQLEAGAFPTSYIPTTGSTATRAADVAFIPTSDFGYNQKQGSIVVEFDSAKLTNSGIYSLYANGSNGLTALVYPSNRVSYQVVDGGAFQVNDNFATYNVSGQTSKVATTYSNNDFAAVLDGGAVSSDTGGSVPTATSIVLGNYLAVYPSSFHMSGHIKSIKYYPRRLSNAQLQELTT